MSVGVPYLFSDDGYYRELANNAGIYYEDGEDLLVKINNLLDIKDLRDEWSTESLKRFEMGKWKNSIKQFNNMLDETISNLPTIKEDTDSYKKIVDFVQKKKSVNKKDILEELGWGVRISFSSYRNKLRKNSNIKFTKDRYEVI